MSKERGFTTTELIVSIAIVGILAAIAVPRIKGIKDNHSLDVADSYANAVKDLRASVISSAVTNVDVINSGLGLPPDARGVIDVQVMGVGSSTFAAQELTIQTKLLRMNGGLLSLETIATSHYGMNQGVLLTAALAAFDHDGRLIHSDNPPFLPKSGPGAHYYRTICYSNSTCDPVTYFISDTERRESSTQQKDNCYMAPGGVLNCTYKSITTVEHWEVNKTRIAVSATGSIIIRPEALPTEPSDSCTGEFC